MRRVPPPLGKAFEASGTMVRLSTTSFCPCLAAWLGAHQPDRELCLAPEPQRQKGEIQTAPTLHPALANFTFRFLW